MRIRFITCVECDGTGKERQERQVAVDVFLEVPFDECDDCAECEGQGSVAVWDDTIFNHAGQFYLTQFEKQKGIAL